MDTKYDLYEVFNLYDLDLWRTRFTEGIISSKDIKIIKKHDPLFNIYNMIYKYNQNINQRIHNDLKFELNQKEDEIVDMIEAENEELHEKIIRERIKTYEADNFGSVHLDVCFVRNLNMKEKLCQRNYKVSINTIETNVFPQIVEMMNPRIKCMENNRVCEKFCIKSKDLKKIPILITYDIKYNDSIIENAIELDTYIEINELQLERSNSLHIETSDFVRIKDGDIKLINLFKIDIELDRQLFCNLDENSFGGHGNHT